MDGLSTMGGRQQRIKTRDSFSSLLFFRSKYIKVLLCVTNNIVPFDIFRNRIVVIILSEGGREGEAGDVWIIVQVKGRDLSRSSVTKLYPSVTEPAQDDKNAG